MNTMLADLIYCFAVSYECLVRARGALMTKDICVLFY